MGVREKQWPEGYSKTKKKDQPIYPLFSKVSQTLLGHKHLCRNQAI